MPVTKNSSTLSQLREQAKKLGIKSVSKLKKNQLEELISKTTEENKNTIAAEAIVCAQEDALTPPPKASAPKEQEVTADKTTAGQTQNNTTEVNGILDIHADGFGFLRGDNYLTTPGDVYVPPTQIRRFNLKTGDYIHGIARPAGENEKFDALIDMGISKDV